MNGVIFLEMVRIKLSKIRAREAITVAEIHKRYILYCKAIGQREATVNSKERFYKYELSKVVDLEDDIKYLTQEKINNHIAFMRANGYKGNYYQTFIIKLKAFLRYCFNNNFLEEFEVKIPTVQLEKKKVYTEEELNKLLKKPNMKTCLIGDYKGWATVNFLLGTGCRAETLLNVHVSDVDFVNDSILFRHMKTKRQISVPMSNTLKGVLSEYIEVLGLQAEDLLFPKLNGQKMPYDTLHQNITKYFEQRKVKMHGVNTFRNTFATLFIKSGGDIYRLKIILGHSNIKTTERYVNLLPLEFKDDLLKYNPLDILSKKNNKLNINKK